MIKWRGPDGTAHDELTRTKVVNAHGCLVVLRAMVVEGAAVELINHETKEVRRGRVVYCGRVNPDGRTDVGVELEDTDPKFWGQRYIDFLIWEACRPA